jgi:hypothetical protein
MKVRNHYELPFSGVPLLAPIFLNLERLTSQL